MTDAASSTPRPASKAHGSSKLISILVVLFSILASFLLGTHHGAQTAATRAKRSVNASVGIPLTPDLFTNAGSKYDSDVVHMTPRFALEPDKGDCTTTPPPSVLATDVPVGAVDVATFRRENKVLILLNAHNEGIVLSWSPCLHTLAATAATALGLDPDHFPNGLRLVSANGRAITRPSELDADRVAHVLLDFQLWIWPGVRVGHVRDAGDGVRVTTMSLSPLVFDVEGLFSEEEANAIIEHGMINLKRSSVAVGDEHYGTDATRTSHTAFLDDNQFTRIFRVRGAWLARLPSPSFVERAQLVRYEPGQFFRRHEDYFHNKVFVQDTPGLSPVDEYKGWCATTSAKLSADAGLDVPADVRPGGRLFPTAHDSVAWEHALLELFVATRPTYFRDKGIPEWGEWLRESLAVKAHNIVEPLLSGVGYILPDIIHAWEQHAGDHPTLRFKKLKVPANGVTQYLRWIRWAKDRVAELGDAAPPHVRPSGPDYPSFNQAFQNKLAGYILQDRTLDELAATLDSIEWAKWLDESKGATDVLVTGARANLQLFELAVEAWTNRAGRDLFAYTPPSHLTHFEPNRFLTLFLYLNDVEEGGETVFPRSSERLVTGIERQGMAECSDGLAVPPRKLHASLFYSQTWDNQLDPMSNHGGCPPARGVKYGANLFTWNVDADEGANALGF